MVPRTQQKSRVPQPVFGPSLLVGHERALWVVEVLWRPEVPARVTEVLKRKGVFGRRREDLGGVEQGGKCGASGRVG